MGTMMPSAPVSNRRSMVPPSWVQVRTSTGTPIQCAARTTWIRPCQSVCECWASSQIQSRPRQAYSTTSGEPE